MIRIKKINKHVVKPINVQKVEPERIKGYDLIPNYIVLFSYVQRKNQVRLMQYFKY